MKIAGDVLRKRLMEVAPGLDEKELVVQSSKFAFQDGRVFTFNDEITCSAESPFGSEVEGVIPSRPLLELLGKLKEGSPVIAVTKGNVLELRIGKKEKAKFTTEAEVVLPLDSIETPEEDDWRALPDGFMEALGVVLKSTSSDDSNFQLICVHFHPEYLESCDNLQMLRWGIETGVSESYLVKGKPLAKVLNTGVTEMAETAAWIHFRKAGDSFVISVRRWMEEYRSKDKILECDGEQVILPEGLADASFRAEIFSGGNPEDARDMQIDLKKGSMRMRGQGAEGLYEKVVDMEYDGAPLSFNLCCVRC